MNGGKSNILNSWLTEKTIYDAYGLQEPSQPHSQEYWHAVGKNGAIDPDLYALYGIWAEANIGTPKKNTIDLYKDDQFKRFLDVLVRDNYGAGDINKGVTIPYYIDYFTQMDKQIGPRTDKNPFGYTPESLVANLANRIVTLLDNKGVPLEQLPNYSEIESYYSTVFGKKVNGETNEYNGKYFDLTGKPQSSTYNDYLNRTMNREPSPGEAAKLAEDQRQFDLGREDSLYTQKYREGVDKQTIADNRAANAAAAEDKFRQYDLDRTRLNNEAVAAQANTELDQAKYLSNLQQNQSSWIQAWKFKKMMDDQTAARAYQPPQRSSSQIARESYNRARSINEDAAVNPSNVPLYQQSGMLTFNPGSTVDNLAGAYRNWQNSMGSGSGNPLPSSPVRQAEGPVAPEIIRALYPGMVNQYGEYRVNPQMSGAYGYENVNYQKPSEQTPTIFSNQMMKRVSYDDQQKMSGGLSDMGTSINNYTDLVRSLLPHYQKSAKYRPNWQGSMRTSWT